jgi:cobalt-zinc-cadmium efflux system outer membrane protein
MDREAMTTAMLPLESIYQRGPRVRQADAAVRAADASASYARQRIALDAVVAFYRTALAQVRVDLSTDLTQWLDSLVAYNRTRVEEGVTAELDLLRSRLERDRAIADGSLDAAELARARAMLAGFLGDASAESQELRVVVDSLPLPLSTSAGQPASSSGSVGTSTLLIRSALEQRPDLRASRERLSAANAGVGVESSMWMRELGVVVGTKQSVGTTSMIAGISLPLPILDRNRGEVARATAERDGVAFELAAHERMVKSEVSAALESARILTARVNTLIASPVAARGGTIAFLERADEARRIARGAYEEGAIPLYQVLDAARSWGEARLAFFQALYEQHQSVLQLAVAGGRDIASVVR